MQKQKLQKIKEKIAGNIFIKPELKALLIADIDNWPKEKLFLFEKWLEGFNEDLRDEVNKRLQNEKKRKDVFHALSQSIVKHKYAE